MIQRLVAFALSMPVLVYGLVSLLIALGLYSYRELDIEAYPNPVPPLVEVIVQPEGWSAEEVEKFVTAPIEIGLAGMPGLEHTRSQSLFGLSDIKCYFSWGTDYYAARQEVINRLQFVQLPPGLTASISPWNAIGEVFRYTLEGPGYTVQDLKTAQDWILERQFKRVPGVIDVVSFGGETKQYQVGVDPFRLRGHGVTLDQLSDGLKNANQSVGGQRMPIGEQSFNVRGVGLLRDVHDIEDVVISAQKGTPVRVRDVADVKIGAAPRLGMVGENERPDVVQGVILMRYGGETPSTLEGIHQRLEHIRKNHILPPGMSIKPYYDRGDLVKLTTHTVMENVVVGIVLVGAVLFLFLGHARSALITTLTIPLALLVAFSGLVFSHTSANLLSLGAIDFGIVVDSTVIMVENIFRKLGKHGSGTMSERILAAASEVAGPMTFATLIIGVSFLPLFTLTGVSGVIFAPMARTYAYAIGGAIILALVLIPTLMRHFVPADTEEKDSWIMTTLHRLYSPLFEAALRRPRLFVAAGVIPVVLCVMLGPLLGSEFMPKLEEGNLWIRATLPMSISLEQSQKYVGRMRDIVRGCADAECSEQNRRHPEVTLVVSQLGRPDDGTDVTGFYNIELFAPLRPLGEWKRGYTKKQLTDELNRELEENFAGVVFNFSQVISDNVEEALAGVKGENSIKVFGPDLQANEKAADKIVEVLSGVRGIKDLGMFHSLGQPAVRITPDRRLCARYGLNTGDVTGVVEAAIGGQAVTEVRQGEKTFDLTVRWLPAFRKSVEAIREITVSTPAGPSVPLGQIASIEIVEGPATVYREDGQRYAPVKFSVRGRDLGSTVTEAQQVVAAQVHLPYDIYLEWSGELNELKDAQRRLLVIIPITLLIIAFLAYSAVRTGRDTLIVLVNIPVACAGGILALLITRNNFSVSAAMGFISIFGIAIQDAILVVTYFQRLRADGLGMEQAALEAANKRLRPVLMTTLVAMLGLTPAALSTGIGSQTQRPLAIVVIGGSLILAVLPRILQPPLLVLAHRWAERRQRGRSSGTIALALLPFLLLGSLASPVHAAEKELASPTLPAALSLEGAVRIFRQHGFDLLLAESSVTSAEGDLRTARQVYNPNLAYTYARIFNYDPEEICPPDTPGGYGGAAACSPNVHGLLLSDNAALTDVLSGKRGKRIAVAQAALRAARMSRADAQRNLEFQVKSQYMQTVLARDQLQFAQEVQQGWAQTYELFRLRYQKGAISEVDEAKVETAKLEADQAVSSARQTLLQAKINLAFLLGVRDKLPPFDVAEDLPKFHVPPRLSATSPDALLREAITSRPDLKAQQAEQERAEAAIAQARRARFPDITLQAGFNYSAPAGGAFSANTTPPTLVLGISSNLPLFYQQQGEIKKAEADLRTQTVTFAKTSAQVLSEVETAYGSYATSRELVERMEGRLLNRARLVRDLSKVQYAKGAASLLEYLDASRTFITVNGEYLTNLANYWIAVFQLEQAVGIELRDNT